MSLPPETQAWLECANREPVALDNEVTIGRAIDNHLIISDDKISRHHALIHRRNEDEFSLVDLGGINGSFVNGRRVMQPRRLYDGDRIGIGDFILTFRQPTATPPTTEAPSVTSMKKTGVHVRASQCWLLIGDIQGSTRLARQHGAQEWARICGVWLFGCKRVVERASGNMADYMGDGFISYWKEGDGIPEKLMAALAQLRAGQDQCPPPFRVVLHFGDVSICGQPSRGEETLFGPEVHFAFRLEKLAGSLGEMRLMSEPAANQLDGRLPSELIGNYPLPGFQGEFAVHRF